MAETRLRYCLYKNLAEYCGDAATCLTFAEPPNLNDIS